MYTFACMTLCNFDWFFECLLMTACTCACMESIVRALIISQPSWPQSETVICLGSRSTSLWWYYMLDNNLNICSASNLCIGLYITDFSVASDYWSSWGLSPSFKSSVTATETLLLFFQCVSVCLGFQTSKLKIRSLFLSVSTASYRLQILTDLCTAPHNYTKIHIYTWDMLSAGTVTSCTDNSR